MPQLTMTPGSTATFTLTVRTATDVPVTTATVTGVFRRPNELVVASPLTFTSAGDGKYTTPIDAEWTKEYGAPKPGKYLLDVTVTSDDSVTSERFTVLAAF